MKNLDAFFRRMNKLGIDIALTSNYPWIYLSSVNGNRVQETFRSEYGFTIAYMPIKNNDNDVKFTDISEIFKIIRKYR